MIQNLEETLEEKWENATLANNFIFYLVMKNNPDLCKELLEILLEIEIDSIEMVQEDSLIVDANFNRWLSLSKPRQISR